MHHLLTVPSAGPTVSVEWTSGSMVRLSWLPVPVEQRRGFIRNYTLLYWTDKREAQSEWSWIFAAVNKNAVVEAAFYAYNIHGLLLFNYTAALAQ